MQATTTKDWLLHFEYPHHLHDVNEECHEMLHDKAFLKVTAGIVITGAVIGLFALGIWLGQPAAPMNSDVMRYPPYYYYVP